jgi:hypothetical protein
MILSATGAGLPMNLEPSSRGEVYLTLAVVSIVLVIQMVAFALF